MSNKLKLTSDSGLTQRPTSLIDTSYRGNSLHIPKQRLLIKFQKVNDEVTNEKPYISLDSQRKVNSCHSKINRKISSEIKNQMDFNEIKQYIQEVDKNYNDELKISFHHQRNLEQYQNEKRINHLSLLIGSFRENIRSRNVSNKQQESIQSIYLMNTRIQQQNQNKSQINSNNKVIKNVNIFHRQKSDKSIGQKLTELRFQNTINKSKFFHNNIKEFKVCSDEIVHNPRLITQQITKLSTNFGDLDNFGNNKNINTSRIKSEKKLTNKQNRSEYINKLLQRQNNDIDYVDNQMEIDESMISETEAKLNQLYCESSQQQKNILNNGNPMKLINSIRKMDQIKQMIDKINSQKLMNKQFY